MGEPSLSEIVETSARGSMYLFFGYASSLIILGIGSIIVGRLLGPEGYGLFSLSLVVPSLILSLIDPGVGAATTRFSAKFKAEGRNDLVARTLKTSLLFRFPIGVISAVFCFLLADVLAASVLNRPEIGGLIRFSTLMIIFQMLFNYLSDSFIGLDKMQGNTILLNTEALVKAILSPVLVILGFSVLGAVAGHVVSFAVGGLVGGIYFLKVYRELGRPPDDGFWDDIRKMISYGFPLYASGLIGAVLSQLQIILLAYFVANDAIGNFNVAVRLLAMAGVIIQPFSSLFPAFSKVKRGSSELEGLFRLSVRYTAMLVVPVTVLIAIVSKDIVYTLYGRVYVLAPLYLSLYALTNIYAGLGSVVIPHLVNGAGETKIILYNSLVYMAVFVPLAYLLTSSYNVIGLIAAILVANTVSFSYTLWSAVKKIRVRLDLRESSRIYLASLISAAPILILSYYIQFYYRFMNLAFESAVFVFVYLSLLPIVGALKKSDLDNIGTLFGRFRIIQPIVKLIIRYESKLLSALSKDH
jgi:O-antigen/teichoic acid export membrane protein